MVITVEPGCYFIESVLNEAFKNEKQVKYINVEQVKKFLKAKFGGVRIEDDVIVTKDGCENMTKV